MDQAAVNPFYGMLQRGRDGKTAEFRHCVGFSLCTTRAGSLHCRGEGASQASNFHILNVVLDPMDVKQEESNGRARTQNKFV